MTSKSQRPNVSPNQTLYVQNLPEKLQKQDLRRQLYLLFSTYGSVLSIVALKTTKMRGQAHITFKDIHTATQAMRNLQDFDFFARPLRIQYAKAKSDFISKLDGTYKISDPIHKTRADGEAGPGDQGSALQQSIFGRLPSASTAVAPNSAKTQGLKRTREEDEDRQAATATPNPDEADGLDERNGKDEEGEEDMEMDESDDD